MNISFNKGICSVLLTITYGSINACLKHFKYFTLDEESREYQESERYSYE